MNKTVEGLFTSAPNNMSHTLSDIPPGIWQDNVCVVYFSLKVLAVIDVYYYPPILLDNIMALI